jgi:hypothetical protein
MLTQHFGHISKIQRVVTYSIGTGAALSLVLLQIPVKIVKKIQWSRWKVSIRDCMAREDSEYDDQGCHTPHETSSGLASSFRTVGSEEPQDVRIVPHA